MQEVSGAHLTDLDGVAPLSSIEMAANQGLHPFLANHSLRRFKQSPVGQKRRMGICPPVARVRRWPMAAGLTQSSARPVSRWIMVLEI